MLGKGKNPSEQNPNKIEAGAALRDFSVIKDWFDYSHNRTMSGLKLANAADIKAAELERDMKKAGRDWNQVIMIVGALIMISVIGFMLIMQFGNITQISDELSDCKGARAELGGNLNVCTAQLEQYQPEYKEVTPEINI